VRARQVDARADITARHPNDPVARRAAWDEFLHTKDIGAPRGYRKYLDEQFPGRWRTEKNTLVNYLLKMYGQPNETAVLPERYRFAGEAIADRIDWALRRGSTVLLGTHWFGQGRENVTAVPGLVGGHAYPVVGIERDAAGKPVKLLLENPWDENPLIPPVAGIEYRLDPKPTGY
ncbi:hypothetical protein ACW9HQ_52180, partial [Nocardia gipuzkoensis]